jgi:hypothetical protein
MHFLEIDTSTTSSQTPKPPWSEQNSQVEAYRKAYSLYWELYPALKSSFEKMETAS